MWLPCFLKTACMRLYCEGSEEGEQNCDEVGGGKEDKKLSGRLGGSGSSTTLKRRVPPTRSEARTGLSIARVALQSKGKDASLS